jgi:hypothetical protein
MWRLFFALSLANAFACAQRVNPQPEGCKIRFAIVWSDNQAGTTVPGGVDDMKWLPKDAGKKYPEVCYDPSATGLRFVVNFNGHYTDQSATTQASPMDGTITDRNGNKSTVTGTVTTTVPSSTSYEYSILSLEGKVPGKDGWTQIQNFGQQSHCHTGYGVCVADRDVIRPLFKDALKWVHKAKACATWYNPSMCPSVFNELPK